MDGRTQKVQIDRPEVERACYSSKLLDIQRQFLLGSGSFFFSFILFDFRFSLRRSLLKEVVGHKSFSHCKSAQVECLYYFIKAVVSFQVQKLVARKYSTRQKKLDNFTLAINTARFRAGLNSNH